MLIQGIVYLVILAIIYYVVKKENAKHKKQVSLLNAKIDAYDRSDKVIKNCVLYGELPLSVTGSNLSFIECKFEDMRRRPATKELCEILVFKT